MSEFNVLEGKTIVKTKVEDAESVLLYTDSDEVYAIGYDGCYIRLERVNENEN